jgi:hypothetical protein
MSSSIRYRIKTEIERLSDLEEQHAHAVHRAIGGDAEASAERGRLLDEIEAQRMKIKDLEAAL